MTLIEFKQKLKDGSKTIMFSEVIALIDALYTFTPVAFTNGTLHNAEGQNSGSCKLFAFAKEQDLSKEDTLACFGEHYQSVIQDPDGDNHQNIRNFIKTGFNGLHFDTRPLCKKA